MESNKTFVDNWISHRDTLLRLLITDAIIKNVGNREFVTVEEEDIDHYRRDYFVDNIRIMRSYNNPNKGVHNIYVDPKARRSEVNTSRLSLPIARTRRA